MTADDRTLGLEGVVLAGLRAAWREDYSAESVAAHVAEQVRAHLAPLGALADEWISEGCGYRFADADTEDECAEQLRAMLAATLGEGK